MLGQICCRESGAIDTSRELIFVRKLAEVKVLEAGNELFLKVLGRRDSGKMYHAYGGSGGEG